MFRELLEELLRGTGADYCCVADATLGKVLDESGIEAGEERLSLVVLGWSATAAGYLAAAAADDLDEMIVTSRRVHHLVRQVGGGSTGPLLVYLRLDRRRGTLAAARRELSAMRLDRPRPAPAAPVPAAPVPAPRARTVAVVAAQTMSTGVVRDSSGPVAVPLPRRQPAALPVPRPTPERLEPAQVTGPAPAGGRWRNDVASMQRLLLALRNLR